jgi:hypothetical protein
VYVELKLMKLCADSIEYMRVYTKGRLLVHVGLLISSRIARTVYPVLERRPRYHSNLAQRCQSEDTLQTISVNCGKTAELYL